MEKKGQANDRARSNYGRIICGRCGRSLAYVSDLEPFDGVAPFDGYEWTGATFTGRIEGTPGSSITTTWPGRSGVDREERHGRHRFICRSRKCRAATKDRGQLSYLDRLPAPDATATTVLP